MSAARQPGWIAPALLAVALGLGAMAYVPILQSDFFSDDFVYLYRAANASLGELVLTPHVGHIHIPRNLLYWSLRRTVGVDPRWYYASSLATHLVNVALLFGLLRRLGASAAMACFGAALWGTLPSHMGTLGWFAVSGHATAATALLAILWSAAGHGERVPSRGVVVLWYGLALLCAASFGVGVAAVAIVPFVLASVTPGAWPPRARLPALWAAPLLAALMVGALHLYAHTRDPVSAALAMPVTVARVGASDAGTLAAPAAGLAMCGRLLVSGAEQAVLGLFERDTWSASAAGTLAAVLFAGVALAAVAIGPGLRRRRVLAFTVLAAGCYAIIAAGRGPLLAVLGQRVHVDLVAIQPRYHYLPSIGLIVVWCLSLGALAERLACPIWLGRGALALWLCAALSRLVLAPLPIERHEEMHAAHAATLAAMREEIARTPPGETAVLPLRPVNFYTVFVPPAALPGTLALFAIYVPDNTVDGRTVVFDVADDAILQAAARGRRTAALVRAAGARSREAE